MKLSAQIETLVAAQGDSLRLATVDVDLAHGDWPDERLSALREALVLASIAHWFDADVLATLADPGSPAPSMKRELEALRCIERFVGRGPSARSVDQVTRRALRKALAETQPARLAGLSTRAAAHFEPDTSLSGQVEHLYHLMVADGERGAAACSALCDRWTIETPPEHQRALALAMDELLDSGVLKGRARGAAQLLVITERFERYETADLRAEAAEVRSLLEGSPEPLDLVRAIDLQGLVAAGLGERAQALQFFGDALARLEALVDEAPVDTRRQHLLAVAHTRLGDLHQWMVPLSALEHFSSAVDVLERLAAAEPASLAVQRELATALALRGGVLLELPDRLADAGADQQHALEMLQALAAAEPANGNRRRDVALQLQRVGDVAAAEGRLPQALASHEAAVQIARELVASDAAQLRWQNDLASTLFSVCRDMQGLDRIDASELILHEALDLLRHLTALQPARTAWQLGLCAVLGEIGSLAQRQRRFETALGHFEGCREATTAALQSRPGDPDLRRECAIAYNRVGQVRAAMGNPAAAAEDQTEAVRIMETLLAEQPDHPKWQQDLANLRSWLAPGGQTSSP